MVPHIQLGCGFGEQGVRTGPSGTCIRWYSVEAARISTCTGQDKAVGTSWHELAVDKELWANMPVPVT